MTQNVKLEVTVRNEMSLGEAVRIVLGMIEDKQIVSGSGVLLFDRSTISFSLSPAETE